MVFIDVESNVDEFPHYRPHWLWHETVFFGVDAMKLELLAGVDMQIKLN